MFRSDIDLLQQEAMEPSLKALSTAPALACAFHRPQRVEFALERLVAAGVLGRSDQRPLASLIVEGGKPLDSAICGLALAGEDELGDALAAIFSCERADISSISDLHKSMSADFLKASRSFPLTQSGEVVTVALADPTDLTGFKGCEFALRKTAKPAIATSSELEAIWRRLETEEIRDEETPIPTSSADDAETLKDLASAEPVVRLCNRLIAEAFKSRASDIHLEPEERAYRVRFRVDGVLFDRETLSVQQGLAAASRFKILSNLDIAERRRPQDGRFSLPVSGRQVDLRISSTPTVFGEGLVLRLLQRTDVTLDLGALGFTAEAAGQLHDLSERPNGILLFTGPTGSGKTTTLYALLQRLAKRDVKILTVEDPVEYRIPSISQTQINPAIGLTFASALRSFLRHDPDIIMVGEMRDIETAKTAVQAALTGHLVLSTLHTNDAPSAVTRLLDMGVEDYLIASTLIGVVAQRLVRRLCTACHGSGISDEPAATVCMICGGRGFHGRLVIAEILEINEELRAAIKGRPTAADLTAIAAHNGFIAMTVDGERKITKGLTTRSELLKAVSQ